jgi:putative PIN family toxin of toxin-antitoxin system
MKVVLDVNVWVSGLLWSGSPSKILRLAQTKTIVIYASELLLQELSDTLKQDKLQRRIQEKGQSVNLLMAVAQQLSISIPISSLEVPELRDSDDTIILATGLAALAEVIITGDKDLLVLSEFGEMPILTPRDFLSHYFPND